MEEEQKGPSRITVDANELEQLHDYTGSYRAQHDLYCMSMMNSFYSADYTEQLFHRVDIYK